MAKVQVSIRLATVEDLDWLVLSDERIDRREHERKLAGRELVVAEMAGERVGLLRLEFLWSRLPFIALVWVDEEHRRCGVGKAFLRFLDEHLSGCGCSMLLSSSQADEPAPQAWHRHVGFEECGVLCGVNAGGVGEVFFLRRLGAPVP